DRGQGPGVDSRPWTDVQLPKGGRDAKHPDDARGLEAHPDHRPGHGVGALGLGQVDPDRDDGRECGRAGGPGREARPQLLPEVGPPWRSPNPTSARSAESRSGRPTTTKPAGNLSRWSSATTASPKSPTTSAARRPT